MSAARVALAKIRSQRRRSSRRKQSGAWKQHIPSAITSHVTHLPLHSFFQPLVFRGVDAFCNGMFSHSSWSSDSHPA
ncbi:hypothetical protein MUK42_07172 [Musa troglodytarum]|uniref:Uncharacterized protein n=1 Tax=Musa troglodytarum TaxID=320322 RepID=A0A9E7KPB0_9LILI|nr:hypothetical protein MUK42_07172 [Musa troglodytarum]